MRSRGILMLLVAVLAGLASVVLAARWMNRQQGHKNMIVVTVGEISLGSTITPDLIKLVEWPETSQPPGSFLSVDKAAGRVVTTTLLPGEPVLEARLAPVGTKGGMSALVGVGKRAMTVGVNDVFGVAGFVLPGTYVDVLVNTKQESSGAERERNISKIVLERMLVLAVAQEVDRDTTKPKVANAVTLEVTPAQAEILDLARSVGTLSLVLRNQTEQQAAASASTRGATKDQLLGLPTSPIQPQRLFSPAPQVTAPVAAPAVAIAPAVKHCVEILRGSNKTTECF